MLGMHITNTAYSHAQDMAAMGIPLLRSENGTRGGEAARSHCNLSIDMYSIGWEETCSSLTVPSLVRSYLIVHGIRSTSP